MPKRNVTLRFTLTTAITTIIVTISMLIFIVGYIGSTQSILLLSKNLTSELSKSICEKITTLLTSAEKTNSQIGLLIRNNSIDYNDKQRLMDLAAQYIVNNEWFTSVDIGNVLGNKYKAERMPDDSISRHSYVRDNKQVTMTWYHDNPANKNLFKDAVNDLKTGYNPQTRPWWLVAVAGGKPTWTDIYISGTRKQFVYTCASPIFSKEGKVIAVSSVDINIVNLSEFLGTLHISKHGRAFIVNDKKQVIAIPIKSEADLSRLVKKTSEENNNPYELYQLQEFPDANIRTAITSWLEQKTTRTTQANFEFKGTGGVAYLANMVDFPYKPDSHFTIGILIPKDDIFSTINRNSMIMFGIIILCLTLALIIGIQISRGISSSLAKLASEVNKVGHLDLDSSEPVSSIITEIVNINNSVENMKKGLSSFEKYVPIDLVRQLNSMQKEAVLGGEKKNISIEPAETQLFKN